MTVDATKNNAAMTRYRLGAALIWLGVLAWLPFIVLWIAGEKPSLFVYLPFHLVGVIGGSRLRSSARKELDIPPAKKSVWRLLGHGLIILGILMWTPYLYLKLFTQIPADAGSYLPYHLTGVLGGIAFLVVDYLLSKKKTKGPSALLL